MLKTDLLSVLCKEIPKIFIFTLYKSIIFMHISANKFTLNVKISDPWKV